MIIRAMLYLFVFLLILLLSFIGFYFWAGSSTLNQQDYSEIRKWDHPASEQDSSSELVLMSYNIGYLSGMTNNLPVETNAAFFEENLEKVVSEINAIQPDFIAFQEIDYGSKRSFDVNQFEDIANACGFNYGARQINWDKKYLPFPYWPLKHHFGKMLSGQAVLSKYPIKKDQRIVLQAPEAPFYRQRFYIDRLLQVSEIDVQGKKLILMNVHLEAFDQETRVIQARKVLGIYRQYASQFPVILAGDFNSDPIYKNSIDQDQEPTISFFMDANELKSAAVEYYPIEKEKVEATFPADQPTEKLDYIFYNPDRISVNEFRVLKSFGTASDHLPVMIRFELK